jgi:hypothetical protein
MFERDKHGINQQFEVLLEGGICHDNKLFYSSEIVEIYWEKALHRFERL